MYVGKRLVGEEVNQSLKRFIEKLLTCKCLKSLEVFRDNKIPLHEVAEWIIKERPDTASIFKIPEKSVMEQVWFCGEGYLMWSEISSLAPFVMIT